MVSSKATGVEASPASGEGTLAAEERWAERGELLASAKFSEKVIEAKEKQLQGLIHQNYSRIKDVEKELAGLQLQLKLTNGPKRSALEMLRRKIETQNEKVAGARRHYQQAKDAATAAEEVLLAEERVKDQLCQELNLLIQESAHAQLEKLDHLTRRLELLNRDLTTAEVDLTKDSASPIHIAVRAPAPEAQQHSDDPSPHTPTNPFTQAPTEATSSAEATATTEHEVQSKSARTADSVKSAAARNKAAEEARAAAAARARHVQLNASRTVAKAAVPAPTSSTAPKSFQGFDA